MPTKDMMFLVVTSKSQRKVVRKERINKPKTEVITTRFNPITVAAMEAVNRGEYTYYDEGMDTLCVD